MVQITYDVDQTSDSMYLLLAFTHFGPSAPPAGSRGTGVALQVLPDMSRVRKLTSGHLVLARVVYGKRDEAGRGGTT